MTFRRLSLLSLFSTFLFGGLFGFGQTTFAQQTISVPDGHRLCLFDMNIFGVRDPVLQRITNEPSLEIKANILIAELSRGEGSIGQSLCGLRLRGSQNASLKNGSTIAPIGQKINIRSLFQAATALGSRRAAEQGEKPAVFFEGGRIRQINGDGSIVNCNPVPVNVYQEVMRKSDLDVFDLSQFGSSDQPVTENSCPRIKANFYQDIGGGTTYMLAFDLTDGGGPNEQARIEEPKLLNNPVPKADVSALGAGLNIISAKSVPQLIGQLLSILMGIIGSIALAVIIAAGLLWMLAAGNSSREKLAMDMLFWGALGVIVILGSYAIVQLVFTDLF